MRNSFCNNRYIKDIHNLQHEYTITNLFDEIYKRKQMHYIKNNNLFIHHKFQ